MDTRILKHGVPTRLFPVVPEARKEQKSVSILLAAMVSVRPYAERVLAPLGVKFRKRTTLSCFTEVTLTNDVKGLKDRPDALIVVETGRSSWSALVEAKVGRHAVDCAQLERYIELAKANNIDAVITVTNELTPAPTINPTQLQKSLPKNLSLYHFSWSYVLTQAFLLVSAKDSPFANDDEAYIVSELIRYLEHPNSGRMPMDQMNKEWPTIVSNVQAGHPINGKAPEIVEMVTSWHQEARDIALLMTRKLREPVSLSVTRNQVADPKGWVEGEVRSFCNEKSLSFDLDVPNAASRIQIEADFLRRSVRCIMKIGAPMDRASNSARINWLLRQFGKAETSKVSIRCITRGKGQNFGAMASEIDPKADEIKALSEIVSFEVEMSSDLGARFNSRKRFIESLEDLVPTFYANVGQHVQAWVPPPPKVEKEASESQPEKSTPESVDVDTDTSAAVLPVAPKKSAETSFERPVWASYWQIPEAETQDISGESANGSSSPVHPQAAGSSR